MFLSKYKTRLDKWIIWVTSWPPSPKIHIAKLIVLTFLVEPFQIFFYVLSCIWLNRQGFYPKEIPSTIYKKQPVGKRETDEFNWVLIFISKNYPFFHFWIYPHLISTFLFYLSFISIKTFGSFQNTGYASFKYNNSGILASKLLPV